MSMQIDNEIREEHIKKMSSKKLLERYASLRIHAALTNRDCNEEAYRIAINESALYEREILSRMEFKNFSEPNTFLK